MSRPSIKNSTIRASLIKADASNAGPRRVSNAQYIKEMRKEKEKQKDNKILSNAYKKVINVITNFFDDKENEESKKAIKTSKLYQQITSQKSIKLNEKLSQLNKSQKSINSIVNKTRVKEKYSYNQPKSRMFLSHSSKCNNSITSKSENLGKKIINQFAKGNKVSDSLLSISFYYKKKLYNSKKDVLNYNIKKFLEDEEIQKEIKQRIKRFSAIKYNKSEKKKSRKNIENEIPKCFFKPKNKLKFRFGFRKSALIPSLFGRGYENKSNHGTRISKKNKSSISNNSSRNIGQRSSVKKLISKDKNSPFNSIQKKLNINIDTKNIKQKLYEYENNEITNQINKLPGNFVSKKTLVKRKALTFGYDLKNVHLNPFQNNFIKLVNQYNKEKKYRMLLEKAAVYDSLDDEEIYDKCINDNFYFEPDSTFLYFLDSIIFIFSLIVLIYLPMYLAKTLYFCKNITDINSIIFYIIDLSYIFDLIINFYRSYYNFDENLITDKNRIFLHYLKTWFLLDFISSLPYYFFLRFKENQCVGSKIYYDPNINNNGIHSSYYNINPYNMHYLIMLIKVFKSFKTFKKNIAVERIENYFLEHDFFNEWIEIFLYLFFFFVFLNFCSCFYIFLGRNTLDSWIFLDNKQTSSFWEIYLAAIYYLVMTVTSVGYGDLIGNTQNEIIFQITMLIAGTCVYTWLISSVSTYVQKSNEKDQKYERKIQILEEMKILNPNFSEDLYLRIIKLLNYRKFHEEETEKNIVLESLPNTLKNILIIEMYKTYINGFIFFKNIENRDFIVKVISKLEPIIGFKDDLLVEEGEHIEDIIIIKHGVLSLEVWIDMKRPKRYIENYLIKNEFCPSNNKKTNYSRNLTKYYEKDPTDKSIKKLKILNMRKNEHFGDVFMFLNKKSPLWIRVRSRKADLLLLKKLDAIDISANYKDIWKKILKGPIVNTKMMMRNIYKILKNFCNYYGIRSLLFKKNKNNNFPDKKKKYKKEKENKKAKEIKKEKNEKGLSKIVRFKEPRKSDKKEKENNLIDEGKDIIKEENNLNQNNFIKRPSIKNEVKKSLTHILHNKHNKFDIIDNEQYIKNITTFKHEPKKQSLIDNKTRKSTTNNASFSFKMINRNFTRNDDIINENKSNFASIKNVANNEILKSNQNIKNTYKIQNTEEEKLNIESLDYNVGDNIDFLKVNTFENNNKEEIFDKFNKSHSLNNEIYPGENFIDNIYENSSLKGNINIQSKANINNNNINNFLSDNVYINNLNLIGTDYLENIINVKGKNFHDLEISFQTDFNINSSYKNINQLTNYQFINDDKLKEETENFLINKCKIENLTSIIGLDTNIINTEKAGDESPKKINKIENTSSIDNLNLVSDLSKSIIKDESFIKNTMNTKFTKSILKNRTDENFVEDIKKQISIGNCFTPKNVFSKKQSLFNDGNIQKNDSNKIAQKKKKKPKDLDLITINLQKSSQNLNQPELFYAGLFSQLITQTNT